MHFTRINTILYLANKLSHSRIGMISWIPHFTNSSNSNPTNSMRHQFTVVHPAHNIPVIFLCIPHKGYFAHSKSISTVLIPNPISDGLIYLRHIPDPEEWSISRAVVFGKVGCFGVQLLGGLQVLGRIHCRILCNWSKLSSSNRNISSLTMKFELHLLVIGQVSA